DYAELGTSADKARKGYITISEEEIIITLMTSKSSQDTAVQVVIPTQWAPQSVQAVRNWITVGKIDRGAPLFRGVRGRNWSLNPSSGYIGVSWSGRYEKWRAQAYIGGKAIHLGYHDDPYQAHLAYCKATDQTPAQPNEDAIL